MNRERKKLILFLALAACVSFSVYAADNTRATHANPVVRIATNMGNIDVELDSKKAPITVKNFIGYVDKGYYNGTVFHRVIKGFMIQGGGFLPGMQPKTPGSPIRNEANNGLSNKTGTISMARTNDPHSAAAQFFINTADNVLLDHKNETQQGWGYAVFGHVVQGMEIVKKIESSMTGRVGIHGDVPINDVIITRIERLKPISAKKN
ncbi:MAG: peptidylprolyl isomerase [Gammaproteobacteria bacterium]|nr:peptidylprolyl isomerase [Gammaproteobacteria bacterium]